MTSKVQIYIYGKLSEGTYRYLRAVRTSNGRIKPGVALKGRQEIPFTGTYNLRYTEGGERKWHPVEGGAAEALTAAGKKQHLLDAQKDGIVPITVSEPKRGRVTLTDAITAYIAQISKPDKNGDRRPQKHVKSMRSQLEVFSAWSKKTYLDELTHKIIQDWRDEMNCKFEPDTVYNRLMTLTVFLKKNPLAPTTPLLPFAEFPDKKETIPDPYTEEEFDAMMQVADYEGGLLLYFFATAGMREQEVAHTEREDIDWSLGEIHIVKKPKYGFSGKTAAARRQVPLPADLLAELALRQPGLLFPNKSGGVEGHYLRIIKRIEKAAGVTPTTAKPYMQAAGMVKDDWCHRFRDTYLTNQLHECKNMADMLLLCKRVGHRGTETLNKYFGKLKKPYRPQLRLRKATDKIQATG